MLDTAKSQVEICHRKKFQSIIILRTCHVKVGAGYKTSLICNSAVCSTIEHSAVRHGEIFHEPNHGKFGNPANFFWCALARPYELHSCVDLSHGVVP